MKSYFYGEENQAERFLLGIMISLWFDVLLHEVNFSDFKLVVMHRTFVCINNVSVLSPLTNTSQVQA